MAIFNCTLVPPPEDQRILVFNETDHRVGGRWVRYEPVWREAHFVDGSWRLWCGKKGLITTEACEFLWWSPVPQGHRLPN